MGHKNEIHQKSLFSLQKPTTHQYIPVKYFTQIVKFNDLNIYEGSPLRISQKVHLGNFLISNIASHN